MFLCVYALCTYSEHTTRCSSIIFIKGIKLNQDKFIRARELQHHAIHNSSSEAWPLGFAAALEYKVLWRSERERRNVPKIFCAEGRWMVLSWMCSSARAPPHTQKFLLSTLQTTKQNVYTTRIHNVLIRNFYRSTHNWNTQRERLHWKYKDRISCHGCTEFTNNCWYYSIKGNFNHIYKNDSKANTDLEFLKF